MWRGAAAGVSGMTSEHLRPILENVGDVSPQPTFLKRFSTFFGWGVSQPCKNPTEVFGALLLGTCSGDLWQRHQFFPRCVVHESWHRVHCTRDPAATVLSIDGIGAFDLVSRQAMLEGLQIVAGGDAAWLFVMQFYGLASTYLWEDQDGVVHTITQAEGGEQGDPLMPALFARGQHPALQVLQSELRDDERLFAFLDDMYVVCSPDRVSAICGILQNVLFHHSSLRVHHGKTQVWNREGLAPRGIDVMPSCCTGP